MNIFLTLLIGFLAGAVAKLIMPGKDPGGLIITTLLGIAGSFVARYLGMALGLYKDTDSAGFIASVATIVLAGLILYLVFKRNDWL